MNFFYTTPLFKSYLKEAEGLLLDWTKSRTPFLVYGAGEHSLFIKRSVCFTSPFFLGFIDQSEARQQTGFLGHPVYSLSAALTLNPSAILVSSYEYQGEIVQQVADAAPGMAVFALYNKREEPEKPEKRGDCAPVNIRGKRAGKGGKRIAVVDTFFSWPPPGGSSVDLSELMTSLSLKGCDVKLFLPYVKDRVYFPRGRIVPEKEFHYSVLNILFSQSEFNEKNFVAKLGDAVDEYAPDYLFLGDMYAFKAPLLSRLNSYKTIWRSYNYDLVCPRMTLVDSAGKTCPLSFLKSPEKCRECVGGDSSLDKAHPILNELRLARVFSADYHQRLIQAIDEVGAIIIYNDILKRRLTGFCKEPEKIRIFPTGIFPDRFSKPVFNRAKEVTILLPGRVQDPVKGFHFYLKVFQKLRKKYSGIQLLVTGKFDPGIDGVRSLGWFPFDRVHSIYKMADFCVIPSLWEEPFGIVALEAMASGIPVLASSVGGLREIVKENKTGFLAPPGDFNAFYSFSEALVESVALRARLGGEGISEAARYSWEKIVNRYMTEVLGV